MNQLDERLVLLKLQPANKRMHEETRQAWRRTLAETRQRGNQAYFDSAFIGSACEILKTYLEEVDKVCREVWLLDGNAITPEFIRRKLLPHFSGIIAARKGSIQHELELRTARGGSGPQNLVRGRHILVQRMHELQNEIGSRYEAEAIECGKRAVRTRIPEPMHPVSAGFTSVSLTKAPKPPTEVGGCGVAYSPKPLRMPSRPDDFPGDLWPRAVVILAKAIERFRDEDHLTELCEHVVEEMTPLYCEAVKAGEVKAHTVLDDRSGMSELLRLLLIANDPGTSSWGLSNQAWDISQRIKTARWEKLAKAIAEVHRDIGADSLRTGINQAQMLPVEKKENATLSPYLRKVIEILAIESAELWAEYGEAAAYVKQLAEIEWNKKIQWNMADDALESHRKRDELIQVIYRDYPEAAKKLALESQGSSVQNGDSPARGGSFTHSDDYRSVTLRANTYNLTSRQAQVIQILHEAWKNGKPDVAADNILESLGTPNGRWQDTFRSSLKAKKALIRTGKRKGMLSLNL